MEIMDGKKKYLWILAAILIIITGGLLWWHASVSITDIEPEAVSQIEIFNGNTGQKIVVTDPGEINHIIEKINKVTLKKEKISLGYAGYSFRITIYSGDSIYREFYINSDDTIRKDPFFYRDSSKSIDYEFINELFDSKKN